MWNSEHLMNGKGDQLHAGGPAAHLSNSRMRQKKDGWHDFARNPQI